MMPVEHVDDLLAGKRRKLLRIAKVANIFAWMVFGLYLLWAGAKFWGYQTAYTIQNLRTGFIEELNWMTMFSDNPLYAVRVIADPLSILAQGIVYGLVLKGIAAGLNMIAETDLNYRKKSRGESHE